MRGSPASSPSRASQEELFPLGIGALRRVVPTLCARLVRHPNDRARAVVTDTLVNRPRSDARDLSRVFGKVSVPVDGALAGAEHPHEHAERFRVGHPVSAVSNRIATEKRGDGTKGSLRCELAHPARFVIDGARVDSGRGQQLPGRAFAAFGPDAKEVRLEDRRPELLLAALPHGAPRRRDACAHHFKRTPARGAAKVTFERVRARSRP